MVEELYEELLLLRKKRDRAERRIVIFRRKLQALLLKDPEALKRVRGKHGQKVPASRAKVRQPLISAVENGNVALIEEEALQRILQVYSELEKAHERATRPRDPNSPPPLV